MANEIKGIFSTSCGMLCVWDPTHFAQVIDYDTWEAELCEDEDLLRNIKAGALVPVGLHFGMDGAFGVNLRVVDNASTPLLTARESAYLTVSSQPYHFKSTGRLCLSGLENVSGKPGDEAGAIELAEGSYAVRVHLLAWDEEPGMLDDNGRPAENALPDFLVTVSPHESKSEYRQQVFTLDPPA